MYANGQIDRLTREEMNVLQSERLRKVVGWAYDKSIYYRKSFDKVGVKPSDIQTVDDIVKLPFLSLSEMNRACAQDFLTLPLSSIIRINYVGEPDKGRMKFFTREDIRQNVELVMRCLMSMGITRGMSIGLLGDLSDNRFLDILYALESIGATVVLLGTDYRKWRKILDYNSIDFLISTQPMIMRLIIQLQTRGESLENYPMRKIICVNVNNIQNPLQQHIEARSGTPVFNLFAPPEIANAGLIFQCRNASAHHVWEDAYLAEIVQFDSGEIIDEDEHMGELVITTLNAQAMPLIRYRTGQAVRCVNEPCGCGRTLMRIATPFTKQVPEFE